MQPFSWRRKFTQLAEDIFRELGFAPPAMLHEDSLPLSMELEVDGMSFELFHSSTEQPSRIVVICELGSLPTDDMTVGMRRLLQVNLTLARCHEASYGISPSKKNVMCMFNHALDIYNAPALLDEMRQIANDSALWKEEFFSPRIPIQTDASSFQSLA